MSLLDGQDKWYRGLPIATFLTVEGQDQSVWYAAKPVEAISLQTVLVSGLTGSTGVDSTSAIGSGSLSAGLWAASGILLTTAFGVGTLTAELTGANSIPSTTVIDSGTVGVVLSGTSGITNISQIDHGSLENIYGVRASQVVEEVALTSESKAIITQVLEEPAVTPLPGAIRVSQVLYEYVVQLTGLLGTAGINSGLQIGSGSLTHSLVGVSGINTANQFGSGVFGSELSAEAGIESGSQLGSGSLSHVLHRAGGVDSTLSLDAGTIDKLLVKSSISWTGAGHFNVRLIQKADLKALAWSGVSSMVVKGKLVQYFAQPEYGQPDRTAFVSRLTQEMLNYFDSEESRIRQARHTLDHQLLNTVAQSLEKSITKQEREVLSSRPLNVPVNLDNRGVYYKVQVPEAVTFTKVEGMKGASWIQLQQYDDMLPVPSFVRYDSSRKRLSLPPGESILATAEGQGSDDVDLVLGPFELVHPNNLIIEVSGEPVSSLALDIHVEGSSYPAPVWLSEQDVVSEELFLFDWGVYKTKKVWSRIDRISVRNLSPGIVLRFMQNSMPLTWLLDEARPFVHHDERSVLRRRFWSVYPGGLQESYLPNRFAGFQTINRYQFASGITCAAIEPNTYGLFSAVGSSLYYFDRREPVPDNLNTGLMEEPIYTLQVREDFEAPVHTVALTPAPTSRAAEMSSFRYTVVMPDGERYAISADGQFVPYTSIAGFRKTAPQEIRIPLTQSGSYLFTMECRDQNGNSIEDRAAYRQLSAAPRVTIDLSPISSTLCGMYFDYRHSLWMWNGSHLIPVQLDYDGYVYEEDQRSVYLTGPYDQVRLS